jgi:KaiC/GvpD/RAD55 family RecA-like ATPase
MGQVWLSFFERDSKPKASAARAEDWEDLVRRLGDPEPASTPKKELPLWSPTKYRDDYRKQGNVELVHLLTYDVDVEPVPDATALRAHLQSRRAVVHSSSRATHAAPRWRVALALSRPVTASEYERLWPAVEAELPFRVGQEARSTERAWYFPRVGPDGFFESFETSGEPLDVDQWLSKAPAADAAPSMPSTPRTVAETPRATRIAAKRAAAAVLLGRAWPTERRHAAQLALAGALKRDGWHQDDALEFLCDVCREAGDEDRPKREKTIAATWRAGENVTGWSALTSHVDPTIVNDARKALSVHAADLADIRRSLRPTPVDGPRMAPAARARKVGDATITRLKTGFTSLDTATRGGLLMRKLVAIGGAPGAGKTAAMIALAFRWLNQGIPVAVLAADEDADALLIRFGQLNGLSRAALESGNEAARDALAKWCESVPLILADGDDDNATIEAVSQELRTIAGTDTGPSVLVVDSMQQARSEEVPTRDLDLRAKINHTVRALKRAAKVDGHLVIASSELARSAYRNRAQAENVNPLSAFKESGDIEYGVALALVLISQQGTCDLVDAAVVKNRLGSGKPEFVLKLHDERADVTETTAAELKAVDPLYFLKQDILAHVDDAHGAPVSRNALHTRSGGARTRLLKAIQELIEAHVLFDAKGGVRRPLPGEPGYVDAVPM